MTATQGEPEAQLVRRTSRGMGRLGWGAGAAGALVVFCSIGFLIPVFIDPGQRVRLGLFNAPMIAAFVALAGFVLRRIGTRHTTATLAWIAEGRDPTDAEHRATLRLAIFQTKLAASGWIAGAIVLSLVNGFVESWGFAGVALGTTWLGGETTCALVYLASERLLRPVTVRALALRPPAVRSAPGMRGRLAGAWALGTGVPLIGVLVVGVVAVSKPGVGAQYVGAAVVFLSLIAVATGLAAALFAAKAIVEPVWSVRRGLEQIERGDLDAHVTVDDASEIGILQAGFNRMADGLRERARIRDLFGRQVGEDVAREALRGGARLGGEEREVGALFVDIVGSTSMALAMPPSEVVALLNRFFRVVVDVAESEGALVDKFEGDAAMCVFGAPVARENPAADALRAARTLATRLTAELPEIDFGIGISAGVAVAGNVGAEHRFEYTVIGDPVNEASRLSDLAKQRPERVLASTAALTRADDQERDAWSITDSAVLRGRGRATEVAHPRP